MGTTPKLLLPYPELTDQANVPTDMKELADQIEATLGASNDWVAYTPVLSGITQGGTGGSLNGAYVKIGPTVHARGGFTAGSSATFSGTLLIGLPVAPVFLTGGHPIGTVYMMDASAGSGTRTMGAACFESGSRFYIVSSRDTNATITNLIPWTWAASDVIYWSCTYQVAP